MIRYAHTNLVSLDWRKLVDFYVQVFDCKLVPPVRNQSGEWLAQGTGLRGAKLEGAHLRLPGHGPNGPTLEIYQYDPVEPLEAILPNRRGFGHIAFEVEDVKSIAKSVEAYGGSLQGRITKRKVEGVGTITFVYARDPEGNLIELQSWKYEE
ncbi:MAG: VOC family protein [Bacteroidota bacterium]